MLSLIVREIRSKLSFTPFIYSGTLSEDYIPLNVPLRSNVVGFKANNQENYFFTDFDQSFDLESELIRFMLCLEIDDLNHSYPSTDFCLSQFLNRTKEPFSFNNEVKGALNSVLISLKAYYQSPNPVIKFHDLVLWTVTIKGSALLKKIRKKSIVEYLMGSYYNDPIWLNDVPSFEINEIGDIFNYQYCFPWKATDESDYLIAFTPCEPEPDALRLFRLKFFELLEKLDDPIKVEKREVLLEVSSSVAQAHGKKVLHYLGKSSNLDFSKIRSPGKRTFITTAPADGRDAIINEINDLNTIQLIDQQLEYLLNDSELSEYLVNKDPKKFEKNFSEFIDKGNYFIMRDIKKEGLQKPKILLKIMLECLSNRWPDIFDASLSNFYSGPWFEGDTTGRGHGLGMANNLTTLMQIVIFSMLIEKIGEINLDAEVDMLCHNDDIIISVIGNDVIDDIVNLDCEILESLGILISRDKSFISPIGGIICERYQNKSHELHPKMSYVNREKLILFTCFNVTHMKSMLSNFYVKFEHQINLNELKSYFGYEFCPEEFDLPIDMGGWARSKSFKISFELKYLENDFSEKTLKVYLANKINKVELRKKRVGKFLPPVLKMFPSKTWEKAPPEVLNGFNILSNSNAYTKFCRLKKMPESREKAWRNLYRIRQEEYKRKLPNISFSQLTDIIMSEPRPIYPPNIAIDRWVDIKVIRETLKDPFNVPNPISCALKKLGLINDEKFNSSFWPMISRTNDDIKKASRRKDLSRLLNFVPPVFGFEEGDTVLPKDPKDFKDFWMSYPAPLLIGKACEIYGKVPILKKKFSKDVWDFEINEEEFFIFQRIPFDLFGTVIRCKNAYGFTPSEVYDIYDVVKPKKYKPKPAPEEIKSYSSSSDDEFDIYTARALRQMDFSLLKVEIVEEEKKEEPPSEFLSWEDSWAAISEITERESTSFDHILFTLDPTMQDIVERVKRIYALRKINYMLTDEKNEEKLRELIEEFADEFPNFLELFELEDPRSANIREDSEGEGQFGDFDLDET